MADRDRPVALGELAPDVLAALSRARDALDTEMPPAERAAMAAAAEQAERRQRELDREALLRSRGAPTLPASLVVRDAAEETKSIRAARRWHLECIGERAGGPRAPRVLVFGGPKDAAKTTAAAWLMARWAYHRADSFPLMVAAEDLHGIWLAHSAAEPHADSGRWRGQLYSPALLVLDDVGQESAAPQIAAIIVEALDIILRKRCDADLHTVITTNEETPEAFCARYASRPRIAERLTEFSRFVSCPVEGFRHGERRKEVLERRAAEGRARAREHGKAAVR